MRKIVLQGKLKGLYQDDINFDVSSVAEAIRALCIQVDGFKEELEVGHYRVYIGDPMPENLIGESILNFNMGDTRDIHIQPVLEGAKGGGGKLIAGIALVGLSFAIPGAVGAFGPQVPGLFGANIVTSSAVARLGFSMVLQGVSALLTPQISSPEPQQFERAEAKPSFLYNGPTNTTEQGGPVPLVYGQMRVGSIVVSSGLSTENL